MIFYFPLLGVVDTFGKSYPELVDNKESIMEIIKEEEEAFSVMLDRGISFFSDLKDEMKGEGAKEVSGGKAFFLYDTLGFPIDLTEQMAEEAGFTVDVTGFEGEMEAQKQRSRDARNAAKLGGSTRLELIAEQTSWLANNNILKTDDSPKYDWDVELPSTTTAIFTENGFLSEDKKAGEGSTVGLIMDKTSFYAEAGGQEADSGSISILSKDGDVVGEFLITDVQVYGGFVLHSGVLQKGELAVGSSIKLSVDYDRRRKIAPNHSMTHVLNAALREVLGDGVEQRGSLCNDEKFRFDFSHKKALSAKQLRKVEELCQDKISNSEEVSSVVMPLSEAFEINGVRSIVGEDYPDPVRVVSVGSDTSVEFCGGTHIINTNEAEALVLVEETAVAKGIRRITGVTKEPAKEAVEEGIKMESKIAELNELDVGTPGLDKQAGALRKELDATYMSAVLKAELRARLDAVQKKAVEAKKKALAKRVDLCLNVVKERVAAAVEEGTKSLVMEVDIGADSKASQKVMNAAKSLAPEMAFLGISEEELGSGGKLMAFAIVPDAIAKNGFKADDWIRAALEVCGGRGGGRPTSAQGQASECTDVSVVIDAAKSFATEGVEATV